MTTVILHSRFAHRLGQGRRGMCQHVSTRHHSGLGHATPSPYLVNPDFAHEFSLASRSTEPPSGPDGRLSVQSWREISDVYPIHKLQRQFADSPHSMLLIFQAMDAAGKDSTIRKVLLGVREWHMRGEWHMRVCTLTRDRFRDIGDGRCE